MLAPILSIQSHVVYGHVGNSAAVFPLQRLGREVWPLMTVQYSSHVGYAGWRGRAFDAAMIAFCRWTAEYYQAPLGEVLRAALPQGEQATARRAVRLTEAGRQALAAGERRAAHNLWRQAAVTNPYDERVWSSLLDVLTRDDDREVCLENIIAINPLNTEARRQLRAPPIRFPSRCLTRSTTQPPPTSPIRRKCTASCCSTAAASTRA